MQRILTSLIISTLVNTWCVTTYANPATAELEHKIHQKLSSDLSLHIPNSAFYIVINAETITPPPNRKSIPLIPDNFWSPSARKITSGDFDNIKKIDITLYVDENISQEERELIELIATGPLEPAGSKLNFNIATKKFPIESAKAKHKNEIDLLNQKILELESRSKTLERERNDIRSELTDAKSKLEDQRSPESSLDWTFTDALKKLFYENSIWILLAVACLACIILATMYLRSGFLRSSNQLATSFSEIAEALNTSGERETETIGIEPQSRGELPSAHHHSSLSSTEYSRIEKLKLELQASLADVDEQYTLHYLTQLFRSEDRVADGVYVMELMPKEIARDLFEKLADRQKALIIKFLMGKHPKNKVELMLTAGEEMLTKLMKGHLGAIEEYLSQELITKVELLNEDLILTTAQKLSTDAIPRFLLYLKPEKISQLLSTAQSTSPDLYKDISEQLIQLAESEKRQDLDESITTTIEQVLDEDSKNDDKKYLPLYKDILSGLEDAQTEEFITALSQQKAELAESLSNSVITLATFFKVARSYQEDIISKLSNIELTAVRAILSTDQRPIMDEIIGERRLDMLTEEQERLDQKGRLEIEQITKGARAKLLDQIRKLAAANGSLADLFETEVKNGKEKRDMDMVA